ncbi:MAG: biopolymer transporter ExbD [Sinimarinibacterium sp.]|jgi:biopolymer transport protein ExbD
MSLRRHAHDEPTSETGIDLAPMLDFVLNLLIFFIITAVFVKEVALDASRPTTKAAESKEAGTILIAIKESGDIFVGSRQTDVRAVRAAIERLHSQKPEDVAVIIAEGAAATGVLVQVMDQVRQGGIDQISISASSPK